MQDSPLACQTRQYTPAAAGECSAILCRLLVAAVCPGQHLQLCQKPTSHCTTLACLPRGVLVLRHAPSIPAHVHPELGHMESLLQAAAVCVLLTEAPGVAFGKVKAPALRGQAALSGWQAPRGAKGAFTASGKV